MRRDSKQEALQGCADRRTLRRLLARQFLDTRIDFDSLSEAGAMMGSGGMVVMDEDTCMVDVARYFLDFTQKESCGKCTFCRIGTKTSAADS